METRYTADNIRYRMMDAKELRKSFLVENLFEDNQITLVYTDADRGIVGSAVPVKNDLMLTAAGELASDYFTQRREIGVINVGAEGKITVDGKIFEMENRDGLYIGRGSKDISFSSENPAEPAAYYLLSYPAHTEYPTVHAKKEDAAAVNLGSGEEANKRTIYKYIHPEGIKSCQLVLGFTELAPGSVWNTMASHTHERRTEIYMYFDIGEKDVVFHFMGVPEETRHLVIRNRQAVISPSWSIHSGAGTRNYTFIWGMGGENQAFDDMDWVEMERLM